MRTASITRLASGTRNIVSSALHSLFPSTGPDHAVLEEEHPATPLPFVESETAQHAAFDQMIPAWLSRSPTIAAGVCVAATLLVAFIDALTGQEFQVVPLYLVPVVLAAWTLQRAGGRDIALLAAVAWLISDLASTTGYAHPVAPYVNAIGLAVVFEIMVWFTVRVKNWTTALEAAVQQRTAALQHEMLLLANSEEARLKAERLSALGTMSAQLTHELRSPLGAMNEDLALLDIEIDRVATQDSTKAQQGHALVEHFRQQAAHINQVIATFMQQARAAKPEAQPSELANG